jgi:D-alanyl-D-alanine dipeptidase
MRVALVALALAGCATVEAGRPVGFVDAASAVPGLRVDMRYAASENFMGRPIDGYEAPVCWLTREAAANLAEVQAALKPRGLGLKVFDCYRPRRAVAHFVRWARDEGDQMNKRIYYPNIDKSRLFELGYIAERSGHSRGSTVDLTLVHLATGAELDMGSPFDLFDPISHPDAPNLAPAAQANRMILRDAMLAHGFKSLPEEWWHFTLVSEPYPQTYFDFPLGR